LPAENRPALNRIESNTNTGSSMSGKITVIVLLGGGLLMMLFGVWFTSINTPIDLRFRLNRTPAPEETDRLFPPSLANEYRLVERRNDGSAQYRDFDGNIVTFSVVDENAEESADVRLQNAMARSVESEELAGAERTESRSHPEATYPYVVNTYTREGKSIYEYIWINGGRTFRVWSDQTNAESLLRFPTVYPY
jgi:hypothetical protein